MGKRFLRLVSAVGLVLMISTCGQSDKPAPMQKKPGASETKQTSPVVTSKETKPPVAGLGKAGVVAKHPPLAKFAQEIRSASPLGTLKVRQTVEIPVIVKNTSTETWPGKSAPRSVRLSYHWLDPKGKVVVHEGLRTMLPRNLEPGKAVRLAAKVRTPDQPGKYLLCFSMIQEEVAWFHNKGAKSLYLPVQVTP